MSTTETFAPGPTASPLATLVARVRRGGVDSSVAGTDTLATLS
ncbi:MAG: hypothetical protein V5A46_03405 [Haloferacaceae archaeon]